MSLDLQPLETLTEVQKAAVREHIGADGLSQARITSSHVAAPKTIVATPAAMFAGGSALASRRWMMVRNESTDTRMRIGAASANLQRDGSVLEPGAAMLILLDPDASQSVYGASEGKPIVAHIAEDVA